MSEEGLAGWEHKSNEQKAKEVKVAFGEEFEYIEVEEEEENKMEEEKEIKEEKKVKEETQAEKKERYIDILVGIGFLKGKEKGDGKERYYYKIDDNSAVGRTFNGRNKLGKFWCKEAENFLKDDQCKKIEIVKRFYSIRDGTEKMPERPKEEKKEIAVREEEIVAEIKPNAVVQDAQAKADMLYSVVEKQYLYQEIRGKKYLTLEAWELLGKFCNLTATVEWVHPVELWESKGFEARVEIKDNEGKVVSTAESMCMNDEDTWKGKPMFQIKSMAQTRAMSKAYRMCLSFIVSLAGYAASPADEM